MMCEVFSDVIYFCNQHSDKQQKLNHIFLELAHKRCIKSHDGTQLDIVEGAHIMIPKRRAVLYISMVMTHF